MEWKSPKAFVHRTLNLLDTFSNQTPYDVTLLVNCSLGICVVAMSDDYKKQIPDVDLGKVWGITNDDIKAIDIAQGETYLQSVVRHMRNALAHFRVDESAPNGVIATLEFVDRNKTDAVTFRAEVPVEHFNVFAKHLGRTIFGELPDK